MEASTYIQCFILSCKSIVMPVGSYTRVHIDLGSVWPYYYNLITVLVGSGPIDIVFNETNEILASNLLYRFSVDKVCSYNVHLPCIAPVTCHGSTKGTGQGVWVPIPGTASLPARLRLMSVSA